MDATRHERTAAKSAMTRALLFTSFGGALAVWALLAATRHDTSPYAPPPRTAASITGLVLDRDGKPLAGALVRAWVPEPNSVLSPTQGRAAPRPTAGESIRDAAARAAWRAATVREDVTGSRGEFELHDLADAVHRISAWAEGYAIGPGGDNRNCLVRPGQRFDLEARPVVELPVTVVLADGSLGREGVGINWNGANGAGGGTSLVPADGIVFVPPGTWDVSAFTSGHEVECAPVRVEAKWSVRCEHVTLRFTEKPLVR